MLTMSFEIGGAPEDLTRPVLILYRGIEVTRSSIPRYEPRCKISPLFIRRWGRLCTGNVAEENLFLCSDSGLGQRTEPQMFPQNFFCLENRQELLETFCASGFCVLILHLPV